MLLGVIDPSGDRTVYEVRPLHNQWTPDQGELMGRTGAPDLDRRRRYWVDPKDLLTAQGQARDRGWVIVGIYHSHPDHPAVPSECDRTLAWNGYSYPILSVRQGRGDDFQSWRLDENQQFQPEPIEIRSDPSP